MKHSSQMGLSHRLMCLVLIGFSAFGQEPMTNDSVVKMLKAGLSEDVVVSMVRSQPAKYSLGADQLIALKVAGVSDKIVQAMVERSAGSGVSAIGLSPASAQSGATPSAGTIATGDPNDPMTPHDSGIYLHSTDREGRPKMVMLEQAAYQGSKTGGVLASAMTYGIKKAKMKAIIPGQHAGIRTAESLPTFYFYFEDKASALGKGGFGEGSVSNPNQFALVKLSVTNSSRETIIGEYGALGASTGTHQKSMVPFKTVRIRSGLYKVTPTAPLEAGEYCFLASTIGMGAFGAGASGAAQVFDFAVAQN